MSATEVSWKVSWKVSAAGHRMAELADLDDEAVQALSRASKRPRIVGANLDVQAEGKPIVESVLVQSGWAARVRYLADGRKQILGLLLPGDLIGHCYQPFPVAISSIVALTKLTLCHAPSAEENQSLQHAYAISHSFDEAHMLAQIMRLGRMNAYERIADFFLELWERLTLAGLVSGNKMHHPLTQETVADVTGLSAIHVNRTLGALRRDGELIWETGAIRVPDPASLSARIARVPTKVTTAQHKASTRAAAVH